MREEAVQHSYAPPRRLAPPLRPRPTFGHVAPPFGRAPSPVGSTSGVSQSFPTMAGVLRTTAAAAATAAAAVSAGGDYPAPSGLAVGRGARD